MAGERIPLHPVDALPELFRRIVEAMKEHILEPYSRELSYRVERRGSERDIGDEWKRGIPRQKAGDGRDVHDTVGEWVEDDDADGFPTHKGI